jgi:hypothetical protein
MKTPDAPLLIDQRQQRLLAGLSNAVPSMQQRAIELDRSASFPCTEFDLLRDLSALAAPLPLALGGLGMGTEPAGALATMDALRLLGRGNLSVGQRCTGARCSG